MVQAVHDIFPGNPQLNSIVIKNGKNKTTQKHEKLCIFIYI